MSASSSAPARLDGASPDSKMSTASTDRPTEIRPGWTTIIDNRRISAGWPMSQLRLGVVTLDVDVVHGATVWAFTHHGS